MRRYRILSIKGAVLDKEQLEIYLEQLASDQMIQNKSEKDTYPVPRMKENFAVITQIYTLLNEHIKLQIPIHPAGEWILDNYYIIEETVKSIERELTLKKYKNFVGISNGAYAGFARVYVLASEIVAYTDGKINRKNLSNLLCAYQNKKTLSMEEIWNIGMLLQIALIENIRNICEKIYSSQMQKYKVESIIERLVENKSKEELKFKNIHQYKAKIYEYGEMKYPFIEYMSYRLRKYGKRAYPFLNILEEQVGKMGSDISEVIKKEHFDIAVKKVSIGNAITSIKAIQRINFVDIFEEINQVEEILKQDPAGVYEKMDYKTKIEYRNQIKQLSKKTKISEIYIAKKCLELAQSVEDPTNHSKQTHIGYYLIDDGKAILLGNLQNKKIKQWNNESKMYMFIILKTLITLLITISLAGTVYYKGKSILIAIILGILLYIPIETIVIQVIQYILGKIVKPKLIPKLDLQNGVSKGSATFVVIPSIVTSKEKVEELFRKLEVYYLANKSENIYFALLGDASTSDTEYMQFDEEIEKTGLIFSQKINEKYAENQFPKFHFIYRKRIWNEKEECYLGWERKRGLLNQFNEYILGNIKNPFKVNTLENTKEPLPRIKYIITLDGDTELVLGSGLELIGSMSHILNTPILNKDKNKVISGYGIMQPRVGINLSAARKTTFTKLYAGTGGTDSYTNAISDIYQDNFGQGIFTGKGIYNVKVFSQVLKNQIPENTVLSHDLLEGNYLRCGLVSDVTLMDGYPSNYNSFKTRLHRWTRGDWQIARWLKTKIKNAQQIEEENPLGIIEKYKIWDNLIRSLQEPIVLLALLYSIMLKLAFNITIWPAVTVLFISLTIPMLLQIGNRIVCKQNGEISQKTFDQHFSTISSSIITAVLAIATLPDRAIMMLNAITKTIYRIFISKKHFLEWTTAEEAERSAKKNLGAYYKNMPANIILGILGIFIASLYITQPMGPCIFSIAVLWLLAPWIEWYISREEKVKTPIEQLSKEEKQYVLEIGKRTWQFFKDNLNEKGHFLPPDNYQEDRIPKVIYRTSPTNIGLGLLAVVSSYDLEYESLEDTISLLEKMIESIAKLQKWNGHLYNWYNIETLEPLSPKYISTVDSGNFIGYLYVLKQFLEQVKGKQHVETVENTSQKPLETVNKIDNMAQTISHIIEQTDFKPLYNKEDRIFSIGFNVEDNLLTPSYYDLLASEARQASFIAIAKKDVPSKHWYSLGRSLTTLNKYKGLISWSGTAFEYLMPNINIPVKEGSLIDESCKFAIMSQQEYANKLNIPWGMSEAAFCLKDLNNNYQYKAFGIPWLGIKRGLSEELVIAPYGSILAITQIPKEVIKNLKQLEKQNMYREYGFYESIDYTPSRLKRGKQYEVVKTYMAHHQGLILLSINNLWNKNILQDRFMENPEIKAVDILLQERMPENVVITKEQKEKIEKIKNIDYETYSQREFNKINEAIMPINVVSNEAYTIVMNQKGEGYSKYNNIIINRFKETDDEQQGIFFYLKDVQTKRIWTANYMNYLEKPDRYTVCFSSDMNKIIRQDGDIEAIMQTAIMPDKPVEIRNLELKNHGNSEKMIEISSFLEPVLSLPEQDYAHKAFNNLFLSYEWIEKDNIIIVKRNKRSQKEKDIYLAVTLYTENECIGEIEYEIDKESFIGRGNNGIPKAVEHSIPLAKKIGYTINPVIAMKRTIKIPAKETVKLQLVLTVTENKEEAISLIQSYMNREKIERDILLSKAKVEAETMYLGLKAKNIEVYQKMLGYLLFQNPLKLLGYKGKIPEIAPVTELWKYGISGDLPILLVKIKDVTDVDVIKDALKAYEYFQVKNINIDLIIMNEEKKTYDNYVAEEIQNAIWDRGLAYKQNIPGGIFVLNNIEKESKRIIEYRANLLINSHLGSIERQLKDLEEEYIENRKEMADEIETSKYIETEKIRESLSAKELKYYNEYGGFSNDGKEYIIRINKDEKLPTVWSHILANPNFGTVTTENMGGYTWYGNSKLNRITGWANEQVTDIPSEIIYLKEKETQKTWSLGANPMPDDNDYYITYGFGYAKYEHNCCGLIQKLDMFIPKEDKCKIQLLHLENTQTKKKEIKLVYYIKPVLGEDEIKTRGLLKLKYHELNNMLTVQNTGELKDNIYITSSEKIESYTGSRTSFIGRGTIQNPEGMHKLELDRQEMLGVEGRVAVAFRITLEALERKDICIVLGTEKEEIACKDMAYKYSNIANAINELERVKKYWAETIEKLQVTTPLESMNIMLNGWTIYQTLCSRIWARSGYYQSGGAYGFRDQLQDCIAMKYIDSNILKNQIIKHSKHQFIEGDVEHWWHEETQRGIRTRFTDDLLWLPYLTAEYIQFTGDYSILEEITTYRKGNLLEEGVDEKYDVYLPSEVQGTIYEHCIKAIEKGINLGKHKLPKIGSGDWNDGFSTVGDKGVGESIWLGFFLYTVLDRFIPIIEEKGDLELGQQYKNIMNELKIALNTAGWDGRWYKRAYMDDGQELGSIQNDECRIDSIAQSWATISGAGDNDKKYISIESLENHLIDKINGIIKLLDPPFEKSKLEPGYIKSYLPGTRENGGQYTHSAIWAVIAEAMLGFGDKALEYYRMINPIEHARTKEEASKYKVEPYVISADIYGAGNLAGRGGWTWYTGSSSWYYEAGIRYILGLTIQRGNLTLEPSIPNDWKEYSIRYKYGNSIYNIKVTNPNGKNTGISKMSLNGQEIKEKQIHLNKSGGIYNIEAEM